MIIHLFNSSLVSGPETLVIPAIPSLQKKLGEIQVWNLSEIRKGEAAQSPLEYAQSFKLLTRKIEVKSQLDFGAVTTLAQALKESKPSIVHAHDVKASVYLSLAAKKLGKEVSFKTVTTHHGINARNGAKVRIYEWIYRFGFLRRFDAVLTVSSLDRDTLLKQGFDSKKVWVHLNGVDRPLVSTAERAELQKNVRAQWNHDFHLDLSKKTIIAVVARLSPEKNHELLLEVLSEFKRTVQDLNWFCVCFGTGPSERKLKRMTSELGLNDRILWAGYRKNLTHDLSGIDLLLSLSHGEGLPINLLEAGWSQTPILATPVDGVNDLISKNEPELLASRLPSNPTASLVSKRLETLLRHPEMRLKLGMELQKRVSHFFSGSAWEQRLIQIYQAL